MKKTLSIVLGALCGISLLTSGCYSTVGGGSKVGMPFSTDKIESRYERPADQVYAAAKDVLAFNGTLTGENTINKSLTAKVDNNTIWVQVVEVEPGITKIVTQSRGKGGGGKVTIASEVDKQIALQLQAR
jgi:hypothetical protein